MSSEKKEEYVCDNCNYPAQSKTEFMDPKTQSIVNHCPMCGCTRTKTQKNFNYRLTWNLLHDLGIERELRELGDVYIQLQEYDSYKPPQRLVSVDIPHDVNEVMREMMRKAQEIVNKADVTDFLKKINVLIIIHVNA